MRKQGTSPCRAPCHRDRKDPAAGGVDVVVGVGDVVVGGGVGVEAEVAVAVEQPEGRVADTSQTWRWVSGRKSGCWGRVGLVRPGLIRRRGTLQSAQRGRAGPGG